MVECQRLLIVEIMSLSCSSLRLILWCLTEKYQKFLSVGANARAEALLLQWLMLQMAGVSLMMG